MPSPPLGRLRPSFVESYPFSTAGHGRNFFEEWLAGNPGWPVTSFVRNWGAMTDGHAVPVPFIEAFAAYLAATNPAAGYCLEAIADRAPDANEGCGPDPSPLGVVKGGWDAAAGLREEIDGDGGGVFCRTDACVAAAARMILKNYGRAKAGNFKLDAAAAVAAGEREMKASLGDYLQLLRRLRPCEAPTVTFALDKGKRVGAAVVAPLTDEAYADLRGGVRDDFSLAGSDILPRSRRLHINALSLAGQPHARGKFRLGLVQMKGLVLSIALTTHAIKSSADYPRFVAFAVSEANTASARVLGAELTGAVMPRLGAPILELRPAERDKAGGRRAFTREFSRLAAFFRRPQYHSLVGVIGAYKAWYADEIALLAEGVPMWRIWDRRQ